MTRLVATLGPHGTITCAQPSCRSELPGIWRVEGGVWTDDDPARLFMAQGWHRRKDGILSVSRRARGNRAFLGGRAPDARRHFHAQLTPMDTSAAPDDVMGHLVVHLPSVAICPFCGTPQQLDPDVLGVETSVLNDVVYERLENRG